ncbi:MAG: hypothetical protein M1816_006639 [Peltula sp. TS41687]|nr:MAG: hypothetical protein M1816_006639 [Peltula sp. TS41687]
MEPVFTPTCHIHTSELELRSQTRLLLAGTVAADGDQAICDGTSAVDHVAACNGDWVVGDGTQAVSIDIQVVDDNGGQGVCDCNQDVSDGVSEDNQVVCDGNKVESDDNGLAGWSGIVVTSGFQVDVPAGIQVDGPSEFGFRVDVPSYWLQEDVLAEVQADVSAGNPVDVPSGFQVDVSAGVQVDAPSEFGIGVDVWLQEDVLTEVQADVPADDAVDVPSAFQVDDMRSCIQVDVPAGVPADFSLCFLDVGTGG